MQSTFDPETAEQELSDIAQQVLEDARRLGADQAEVAASQDRALSVTVRLGEVETLEHHRDKGLSVTVYFGQRKGQAASADLSAVSVKEVVERACTIAKYTQDDPCSGLADADLMASSFPDLDLWHPWDLSPEQAIVLATDCEDAARSDQRITNSEGASVASGAGVVAYANSHGFYGVHRGTRHDISCAVIAGKEGGMQVDHWYTVARRAEDLDDAHAVGRRAAERAVARLDSRRLKTSKANVLFTPETARGLIGHFVGAIRGSTLYREASFLLDQLGKSVFAPQIEITEQPYLQRALGSSTFDGDGVAPQERVLVHEGVLQGYVLDAYSARQLKMESTGNAGGVHNLTLQPGERDFEALLRGMNEGLVVTDVMGQGVNLITGDYSRGAAGFWVEGGEIAYPVHEITVAGNLRDMFQRIVAVGSDLDTRANIRTGSILIEEMTIAGE